MGTTYIQNGTKAQVIKEASSNYTVGTYSRTLIAKRLKGNELWMVFESNNNGVILRGIVLALLSKSGGDWGYKLLCEIEGPYYYQCPLEFLDLAETPNHPAAKEWREKVRRYHILANIPVGTLIEVETPITWHSGRSSATQFFFARMYKRSRVFLPKGQPSEGVRISTDTLLYHGAKVVEG